MKTESFPPLPLKEWEPTKKTLHLYAQIVGKIRMTLMPEQNHWWHVTLYVDTNGLTTGSIPINGRRFEISFDFAGHKLSIETSEGTEKSFALENGLSVASFYENVFTVLNDLNIEVDILAKPYDHESSIPFAGDRENNSYDKQYVENYWKVLSQTDRIFRLFNRNFRGKVCPVQLYWHSFDLAVTRFSGKQAPPMPEAGRVDQEAYSHEVISFGFWAGDENIPDAAFYSYTYPAPEDLNEVPLKPGSAFWSGEPESPMALMMYEDARTSGDPENAILMFLESAWQAGVEKAGWDTGSLLP